MKYWIITFILFMCTKLTVWGQFPNDSIYQSWWDNKYSSIFNSIDSGKYFGNATGFLQIKINEKDIVLDFQSTELILEIDKDSLEMYDNSTKIYTTKTTSGKTELKYKTYALANDLTININGDKYQIGMIDGACDWPIKGMVFNYCNENTREYLSLYVNDKIKMTNTKQIVYEKDMSYLEARQMSKEIILKPGSTMIFTIKK